MSESGPMVDISDSKSTLNDEVDFISPATNQTIEVTADSVLIKKEKVGQNRHGEVFKGERVSMYSELGIQDVLINEINLSEKPMQGMQFFYERSSAPALSYSINSPHIAKCFGLYMNSKGNQIWLVTEFLPFSVHDLLESGPLEEQQIAFIVAEVIKGLDYLHSLGICHGDVVSDQVKLTPSGEVKLAGFHLAADTLNALHLDDVSVKKEDSGYKGDILSLGKMAVELIQGEQISKEHALAEREIPSLLNQFSHNFRNIITSCLHKDPNQRPSAAQLMNHPLVKKMRKTATLKDYKLLFNRCKRFKRSIAKRKRNYARRESGAKRQLSKVDTQVYDEMNGESSSSDLQSPITPQDSRSLIQSESEICHGESDLPVMKWDFSDKISSDHLMQHNTHEQRQQSVSDPIIITFKNVTVITEERINHNTRNSTVAEKVFRGTYKDSDQPSLPCLVREINLNKLSPGTASELCNGVVTPLLQGRHSNIVKVLQMFFTESEEEEVHDLGSKLYIVTEYFVDNVHDLLQLEPLDEHLIAWILREVLKGLDYLHSQRIAYGNMTARHILFSVASGSFEVKLDHTHAVVDELDDKTASNGSEASFNRNLKADIWSVGVIAAQLAHSEPPSHDPTQPAEESVPSLPSTYSTQFAEFVGSCLQKSRRKRPTAHELLQSSFIKDAKEMCGLEAVFDLYWKHKINKDKQLYEELTNGLELNLDEWNLDIDGQVPPTVNWNFDESDLGPLDETKPTAPQQPPLQSNWNENENEIDDASSSQVLTKRHRQLTQESVCSQNTDKSETELSPRDRHHSTPLWQQKRQLHGSSTSLPGQIHSRVKHKRQQGQRHPLPRPESYVQPPPHLQAGPWWMYPPWLLPPPWWLAPPSPQRMASGQYGTVNPMGHGLGFYPQSPWWHQPPSPQQMAGSPYGSTSIHSPGQGLGFHPQQQPRWRHPPPSMADGQQTHHQTQGMSSPWWPPRQPSWWHYPPQQPSSPAGRYQEERQEHTYQSSNYQHLTNQHEGSFHQQQSEALFQSMSAGAHHHPQHEAEQSQEISQQLKVTGDVYLPQCEAEDTREEVSQHSVAADDDHLSQQEAEHLQEMLAQSKVAVVDYLPQHEAERSRDASVQSMTDNQLPQHELEQSQEVFIWQSMVAVDNQLPQNGSEKSQGVHISQQPMAGDEHIQQPEKEEESRDILQQPTEAVVNHLTQREDLGQSLQPVDPQICESTPQQSKVDDHTAKHEYFHTQNIPLLESTADPQPSEDSTDSGAEDFPPPFSTTNDDHVEYEDMVAQHIPLLQSLIDNDMVLEEHSLNETSLLQTNLDDLVDEHPLAEEQALLQLSNDKEALPEDRERLQLNKDLTDKDLQPQGMTDNVSVESEEQVSPLSTDEDFESEEQIPSPSPIDIIVVETLPLEEWLPPPKVSEDLEEPPPSKASKDLEEPPRWEVSEDQEKQLPSKVIEDLGELAPPNISEDIEEQPPSKVSEDLEEPPPLKVNEELEELPPPNISEDIEKLPSLKASDDAKQLLPMKVSEDLEELSASGNLEEPPPSKVSEDLEEPPPPKVSGDLEELPPPNIVEDIEERPPSKVSEGLEAPPPLEVSEDLEEPPPPKVNEELEELPPPNISEDIKEQPPLKASEDLGEPLLSKDIEEQTPSKASDDAEQLLPMKVSEDLEELAVSEDLEESPPSEVSEDLEEPLPSKVSEDLEEPSPTKVSEDLEEPPPSKVSGDLEEQPPPTVSENVEEQPPSKVSEDLELFPPLKFNEYLDDLPPKSKDFEEPSTPKISEDLELPKITEDPVEQTPPMKVSKYLGELPLPQIGSEDLEELIPQNVNEELEELSPPKDPAEQHPSMKVSKDLGELPLPLIGSEDLEAQPPPKVSKDLEELNVNEELEELSPPKVSEDFEELSHPKVIEHLEESSLPKVNEDVEEPLPLLQVSEDLQQLPPLSNVTQEHEEQLPSPKISEDPVEQLPPPKVSEEQVPPHPEDNGDLKEPPPSLEVREGLEEQSPPPKPDDDFEEKLLPPKISEDIEGQMAPLNISEDQYLEEQLPSPKDLEEESSLTEYHEGQLPPPLTCDVPTQSDNDKTQTAENLARQNVELVEKTTQEADELFQSEVQQEQHHHPLPTIMEEFQNDNQLETCQPLQTAADHQEDDEHPTVTEQELQSQSSDTVQDEAQPLEEAQSEHLEEYNSLQPEQDVMEVGYSLKDLVKPQSLTEQQIAAIILKVVQILDDLHSQEKVNNNVTIANITLSESGRVKLTDSNTKESVLSIVPGAEELLEQPDDKADIWSLGITAVEIANGEPPDANMLELLFASSFITPQFLDDDDFSEEFEDFVGSCLKSDPDERFSAQELLDHEFLTSAITDTTEMSRQLISQYKDWKNC